MIIISAAEKEKNVRIIEEEVSIKSKLCQEDLLKAEPIMRAAIAALDTLDKNNLTELKSFGSPAPAVVDVASAVLVLMSKGKIPKDRSWKACKVMMGNVGQFLDNLKNYDKKNISADVIKALMPYLEVCKAVIRMIFLFKYTFFFSESRFQSRNHSRKIWSGRRPLRVGDQHSPLLRGIPDRWSQRTRSESRRK